MGSCFATVGYVPNRQSALPQQVRTSGIVGRGSEVSSSRMSTFISMEASESFTCFTGVPTGFAPTFETSIGMYTLNVFSSENMPPAYERIFSNTASLLSWDSNSLQNKYENTSSATGASARRLEEQENEFQRRGTQLLETISVGVFRHVRWGLHESARLQCLKYIIWHATSIYLV